MASAEAPHSRPTSTGDAAKLETKGGRDKEKERAPV